MVVINLDQPWLLLEDLNEVLQSTKNQGGKEVWRKRLFPKEFMQAIGGIDLGFIGQQFTQENRQEHGALLEERLDRGVACSKWIALHPKAIVEHLIMEKSYHCPIMLRTFGEQEVGPQLFRFLKAWIGDPFNYSIIQKAWNFAPNIGMMCHCLTKSLLFTSRALKHQNSEVFDFAHIAIVKLEELKIVQSALVVNE